MKRLLFLLGLFLFQLGYSQTDVVTLSRIKDFINAGLTYIIISNDSIKKNTALKNWSQIDTALKTNTLQTPVYYSAMQKLLEGEFDSVTKKFSAKVDLIDVRKYSSLNEEQAIKALFDTAFSLMQHQYAFVFPANAGDSIYMILKKKTIPQQSVSVIPDTIKRMPNKNAVVASGYVPWYARFQGFVFWLLACVLISVALFLYCLDQIRQLKIQAVRTEKQIDQLKEDKEHEMSQQGPVTTVYAEFRNLVTLKIKELYDIIDHLNQRIIHLETTHLPVPSLATDAGLIDDAKESDEIFYMSVPLPGHFPFNARSLKKDALYKFTLNNNDKEAHFEVINDGFPIGEALKDLSQFFEPACIAENTPQGEVRVIITKVPGTALLDGEKWLIQQKASIIFI